METLRGPDLTQGVEPSKMPDGTMLRGYAGNEPILLVRRGDEFFALGLFVRTIGAPLNEGSFGRRRDSLSMASRLFYLRTGEVLRAPALDALTRWRVEVVFHSVQKSKENSATSQNLRTRKNDNQTSRNMSDSSFIYGTELSLSGVAWLATWLPKR